MSFTRVISKYKAIKTEVDGIKFDSKKEAKRYQELKLLEKSGKIKDLQLQVPYIIIDKSKWGRAIKYVCDFQYYELQNNLWVPVVEDTKGYRTAVYKLKKRLVAERYEIVIRES